MNSIRDSKQVLFCSIDSGVQPLSKGSFKTAQKLNGSLVLGFSRESIGFDVAVNAIAVTESIPLTVEIETNECSTRAVLA